MQSMTNAGAMSSTRRLIQGNAKMLPSARRMELSQVRYEVTIDSKTESTNRLL